MARARSNTSVPAGLKLARLVFGAFWRESFVLGICFVLILGTRRAFQNQLTVSIKVFDFQNNLENCKAVFDL